MTKFLTVIHFFQEQLFKLIKHLKQEALKSSEKAVAALTPSPPESPQHETQAAQSQSDAPHSSPGTSHTSTNTGAYASPTASDKSDSPQKNGDPQHSHDSN